MVTCLRLEPLHSPHDTWPVNAETCSWQGTRCCGAVRPTQSSAPLPACLMQGGSFRAHMPDLETDSGTLTPPSTKDSTDLDADIMGEEVRQANAIIASRSFFRKG